MQQRLFAPRQQELGTQPQQAAMERAVRLQADNGKQGEAETCTTDLVTARWCWQAAT